MPPGSGDRRGRAKARRSKRDWTDIYEPDELSQQRDIVRRATSSQKEDVQGLPFQTVVVGFKRYLRDTKVIRMADNLDGLILARGGPRRPIVRRTKKTRTALAFLVANSPTVALGMITLTWPEVHLDGKAVKLSLRAFFDQVRKRFERTIEWVWWLEFQRRGAPHVHVLTSGSVHDGLDQFTFVSKQKTRVLFRGDDVEWVWMTWLRIIGHRHNDKAIRFSRGGIWEAIMHPDGAARYVAKDAWKPHQTSVPKEYSNVGAWWHRSRGWLKPEPLEVYTGDMNQVRSRLGLEESETLYPIIFGQSKNKQTNKIK